MEATLFLYEMGGGDGAAGLRCHCEERSDAAISIAVRNGMEIAFPRLRRGPKDNGC